MLLFLFRTHQRSSLSSKTLLSQNQPSSLLSLTKELAPCLKLTHVLLLSQNPKLIATPWPHHKFLPHHLQKTTFGKQYQPLQTQNPSALPSFLSLSDQHGDNPIRLAWLLQRGFCGEVVAAAARSMQSWVVMGF